MSDHLKEILEALARFEDEMDYVAFETSTDYHLYQSLMKNLRAVIEAFPVETPSDTIAVPCDVAVRVLEHLEGVWDDGPRYAGWKSIGLQNDIAAITGLLREATSS